MRTVDSKIQLLTLLRNSFRKDYLDIFPIYKTELIDTGKMLDSDVNNILNGVTDLDDLNIDALVLLYSALLKYNTNLPPIDHFFEDKEIKRAENFITQRTQSSFPLEFDAIKMSNNEEYLICLTAQEIFELHKAGIITINAEMQRESVITNYNGQLVSHVAYKDKVSRDIANELASGDYRSDMIRWNLVVGSGEDYGYNGEKLLIKSGEIALLDGQHRSRGIEYALIQNPDIERKFPISLTIEPVTVAQQIIAQHEKQQPINKKLIKTYEKSVANNIVRALNSNPDLQVYKFVNTNQEIKSGAGFVLNDILSEYIEKFYNTKKYTPKQQKLLEKWLSDFLIELADIFFEDFKNYNTVKKLRWNVSPYAFAGYLYLSSVLKQDENWDEELVNHLNQIDFNINSCPFQSNKKKPDAIVANYFKEVIEK